MYRKLKWERPSSVEDILEFWRLCAGNLRKTDETVGTIGSNWHVKIKRDIQLHRIENRHNRIIYFENGTSHFALKSRYLRFAFRSRTIFANFREDFLVPLSSRILIFFSQVISHNCVNESLLFIAVKQLNPLSKLTLLELNYCIN